MNPGHWRVPSISAALHGGPDGAGAPRYDFSSNANAAGPLPTAAEAVMRADRCRYPDPAYRALRDQLGGWHGVAPERIVVAGSASEFIHRFTRLAAHCRRVRRAAVPCPGYGDYAVAARTAGIDVDKHGAGHACMPTSNDLWWITEPASPTGSPGETLGSQIATTLESGAVVVLDLAYQPLRFDAAPLPRQAASAWQLWSPNKSCGLPGVRGAYAVAPPGDEPVAEALRAHAPSWVVGAEGVAMLTSFTTPPAQAELAAQKRTLHAWRTALSAGLRAAAWHVRDDASVTPFLVAQPPAGFSAFALRQSGIKLRDTESLGLPGWVRLSAQPPAAIEALLDALARVERGR